MTSTSSEPIVRVAVPVPLPGLFDYLPPRGAGAPVPGARVRVRFGQRRLVGVVMEIAETSEVPADRLARVEAVLDGGAVVLDAELRELLAWCARYYKHAPGEVVLGALPPALRNARGSLPAPPVRYEVTDAGLAHLGEAPGRAPVQRRLLEAIAGGPLAPEELPTDIGNRAQVLRRLIAQGWVVEREAGRVDPRPVDGPPLTAEQRTVLDAIEAQSKGFACHLVDGITGSGKTEIYLRLARKVIEDGGQVLVLLPEIGLTPQLVRRFRERLGVEPVVAHSGLAAQARLRAWDDARSGRAPLVLGTRSALFLPLARPGLIVLDEEHDASFKQQDGFRYSGRDVAVKRAAGLGIPVLLGSATPSLETLANARAGRYAWHRLRRRATGGREPGWRVLDLRCQRVEQGLAPAAHEAIGEVLERGEKALLFLNRRGYAPVLLCHECGWHGACRHCDANLTWHRGAGLLQCHHCGATTRLPRFCPECRADALQGAGQGTEQLEATLARRYPDVPLLRFDRDQTRGKDAFEALYDRARAGGPGLLVGTQMLAKGHHLPSITLVVVVSLDEALYSADYRAIERMGQLLVQVAGRAGRGDRPGEVLLQTHHPEHPALERLLRDGYEAFAGDLLAERSAAGLPPASHQALLRAEARDKGPVLAFLEAARGEFPGGGAALYGPLPAIMERRRGRLRWHLLVQAPGRGALHGALEAWLPRVRKLASGRRVRWALDVDPQEF